jgi:type 1 fimbriae regulatory protein FimB/type 1 fimbriae regulatory protein FimE
VACVILIQTRYLGHKNIQHTVRYTELAPTRFKNFWKD